MEEESKKKRKINDDENASRKKSKVAASGERQSRSLVKGKGKETPRASSPASSDADSNAPSLDPRLLTADDVINAIKAQPGIPLQQLAANLRLRLKAHETNKKRLARIIKKIARTEGKEKKVFLIEGSSQ